METIQIEVRESIGGVVSALPASCGGIRLPAVTGIKWENANWLQQFKIQVIHALDTNKTLQSFHQY
jgi:hypothetical protein